MKHAVVGPNFKIILDQKRVMRGGLVATFHTMFLRCECAEDRCTCSEEDEDKVLFFVKHNAGKRKFVRSMGLEIGYGKARRLWAKSSNHKVEDR